MKRLIMLGSTVLLAACDGSVTAPSKNLVPTAPSLSVSSGTCTLADGTIVSRGFDAAGWNLCAGLFNGTVNGDNLVMKWNAQYDICNAAGTDLAAVCLGAWISNEWNGNVPGGSGIVSRYKIIWVGPLGETSPYWVAGGYSIWGSYEIVLWEGTYPGYGHLLVNAHPSGYGAVK
jgi:hypothetical protein